VDYQEQPLFQGPESSRGEEARKVEDFGGSNPARKTAISCNVPRTGEFLVDGPNRDARFQGNRSWKRDFLLSGNWQSTHLR